MQTTCPWASAASLLARPALADRSTRTGLRPRQHVWCRARWCGMPASPSPHGLHGFAALGAVWLSGDASHDRSWPSIKARLRWKWSFSATEPSLALGSSFPCDSPHSDRCKKLDGRCFLFRSYLHDRLVGQGSARSEWRETFVKSVAEVRHDT